MMNVADELGFILIAETPKVSEAARELFLVLALELDSEEVFNEQAIYFTISG